MCPNAASRAGGQEDWMAPCVPYVSVSSVADKGDRRPPLQQTTYNENALLARHPPGQTSLGSMALTCHGTKHSGHLKLRRILCQETDVPAASEPGFSVQGHWVTRYFAKKLFLVGIRACNVQV